MSWENLSPELQNIAIYNYEVFIRVFWIFLIISFSIIYLFYIREREKKTPFWAVALVRLFFACLSFVNLILSPLFFLGLSPQINAWDYITPYFWMYFLVLMIYIISINIDFLRLGIPVLLRMGGLDFDDPDVELAFRKFKNFIKNGRK